ncbi:hypothetical protein [Novosphingobium sp. 9U]|uniref:hypothetical protein n=1 Tax=Novosphingobium sp. 9U TaxID=2653158 RepID=UPI0012F0706F|nr:hypothetical protein [Novosphingobium sp. 9U]VWX52084.1 conserved hypothetical protein [Novosphingobium sp. 9U]
MVETTTIPGSGATGGNGTEAAKNHFSKAVEEALAGAKALGAEAQNRAGEYREKLYEKKDGLAGDAKVRTGEYKEKAFGFADQGKAQASGALASLSQLITDNAGVLDEKVGAKYGDYARGAAKSVQDVATRLDEKSLDELGEDAVEFVRQSPALALGMAAAAGYLLGRVFK